MTDTQKRQYLGDLPRDIQDLIYEGQHEQATQLLMKQKGLQKMQAAMEAGRIAMRMSEAFPETSPGLSPGAKSKLTSTQKYIIAWAFVTLFAATGCTAVYYGGRGIIMGAASSKWPSVKGTIKKCEPIRSSSNEKNRHSTVYHARVIYEFTVDGKTFTGDQYSYGEPTQGSYSSADSAKKQFPQGTGIKVHYDPADPRESVLEAGIIWSKSLGWLVVGLILVGLTSLVAWVRVAVAKDEREAAEQSPAGDVLKAASEE